MSSANQLLEHGVILLRDVFAKDSLIGFRDAATRCFEAVEADNALAEIHKFNR